MIFLPSGKRLQQEMGRCSSVGVFLFAFFVIFLGFCCSDFFCFVLVLFWSCCFAAAFVLVLASLAFWFVLGYGYVCGEGAVVGYS